MAFITLLGDSSFANLAHVGPPELITQLRQRLPEGWQAHLSAIDGARVADVHLQLPTVPPETTNLLVSVGGNDAIALTGSLRLPAANLGSALAFLDRHRRGFADSYRGMLAAVRELDRPTMVCTIYNPRLVPSERQRIVETIVALLNDAILSAAVEHGVSVLDLRPLSDDPENFVTPIELNHRGAGRLAEAIPRVVHDASGERVVRVVAAWPPPEPLRGDPWSG
jgi:hypothetical protein